jgi:hypothetical protein
MELTPKACGDRTNRKKTLNHTARNLGMRIRYFKDESDFKTTQFLTDEKTPQCPSLKK